MRSFQRAFKGLRQVPRKRRCRPPELDAFQVPLGPFEKRPVELRRPHFAVPVVRNALGKLEDQDFLAWYRRG